MALLGSSHGPEVLVGGGGPDVVLLADGPTGLNPDAVHGVADGTHTGQGNFFAGGHPAQAGHLPFRVFGIEQDHGASARYRAI